MNLQIQTNSNQTIRHSPAPQAKPESKKDDRYSDFDEVLNLLRYDGEVSDDDNSNSQFWRRRVKTGQTVVHMGQTYDGLYVVRFGALKTVMTQVDGSENVLAFPMKGNLVGFDGICKSKYLTDVIALSDCDLIKLPDTSLFSRSQPGNDLERLAYWAISREIANEQAGAVASRSVKSEVRVARFLRIQSERFATMGYSPRRFTLPMTRRDIGSHLNVTLESVSRAFSAMDDLGIITIDRRDIEILSFEALNRFENQGRLSS